MRGTTERPEGVAAGVCRLVGTNPDVIIAAAEELFARPGLGEGIENPYGDGRAADRIVTVLEKVLVKPAQDIA